MVLVAFMILALWYYFKITKQYPIFGNVFNEKFNKTNGRQMKNHMRKSTLYGGRKFYQRLPTRLTNLKEIHPV